MDTLSPEVELQQLREENRRLKALLELREDNAELERYQVQSRNKLLGLLVFTVLCVGVSWIMYFETKSQLNEQVFEAKAQVKQMQQKMQDTGKFDITPTPPVQPGQ